MVLFAFKDDEVLRKILKFVARRNTKRNYFLVLTVDSNANRNTPLYSEFYALQDDIFFEP